MPEAPAGIAYGVEPICRELPIAPSTCHAYAADSAKAAPRVRRDSTLREPIRRIWAQNFEVYGGRKVRRQLGREGIEVARCAIAERSPGGTAYDGG